MIRIREKNCNVENGNEKGSFCTFDIYWRNSKDDLLHPYDRCIDVLIEEMVDKSNNKHKTLKLDGTPVTLKAFHEFLKDNGIQWCSKFRIFYRDEEGDDIPVDSDEEYKEALKFLLSYNENTKENVMMIIESDTSKANVKLKHGKASAQLKTSMPNTSAIDPIIDDSMDSSASQKDTAPNGMNSSNGMKSVASDSSKNEEAFYMLQTYLENFKKEIVNDVVEIIERKLTSALGNLRNENIDLKHESSTASTSNQGSAQYGGMHPSYHSRDELHVHGFPMADWQNIRTRSFTAPFPKPPVIPTERSHSKPETHQHNYPQFPPPNAFSPLMNLSEYDKYVSLVAQTAASSKLASDLIAKCSKNSEWNNPEESKLHKETHADKAEAMEIPENVNRSPTDSSSFEILSANSSPVNVGRENCSPSKDEFRTVEMYDCSSDEGSPGDTCNPTFRGVPSSDSAERNKMEEEVAPELEKRPGGAYSYVHPSLLSTPSDGMAATDVAAENNMISSEKDRPTGVPKKNKKRSTNRHASNSNRSSRMSSNMDTSGYASHHKDEKSTMNDSSSHHERNEFMNSQHNPLHNVHDHRQQNSRPTTASNEYPDGHGGPFGNRSSANEYFRNYDFHQYYPRPNDRPNDWINPMMINPLLTGAYDAAQQALSVAHEMLERTSKSMGPKK